jgi:hypothetical protein
MGEKQDRQEYQREKLRFEEELVSGSFFLKWIFLAWICLEPLLAIAFAGYHWLGNSLLFWL